MNRSCKMFMYILIGLHVLKCIQGQVRTNVKYIQHDFYTKAAGFDYTMDWFKPYKMTNYAKLLLCVDVLQKRYKIRLMGSQCRARNAPIFALIKMRVRDASFYSRTLSEGKTVMHCPMHEIHFENYSYPNRSGFNFFITESVTDYCLYILEPIGESILDLVITAEVCGALVNVRYDTAELEREYLEKTRHADYVDRISESEFYSMSNENKFLMCLDVYEKISRHFLYPEQFKISSPPDNKFPEFKNIIGLHFLMSGRTSESQGIILMVLCPMHKIIFPEIKRLYVYNDSLVPYYIGQSVNSDCVYKLGVSNRLTQQQVEEDFKPEVFIEAEVCGIFGPVTTDVSKLESQYANQWSPAPQLLQGNQWSAILNMDPYHHCLLCVNVYKKISRKYSASTRTIPYPLIHTNKLKYLTRNNNQTIEIRTVYCLIPKIGRQARDSASFYLAESSNIDCVYKLASISSESNDTKLAITAEICGVYPLYHLLQIDPGKTMHPLIYNLFT